MKKTFFILMILINVSTFSQSSFDYGIKLKQAKQQNSIEKIPLLRFDSNKLNYFITPEDFIKSLELVKRDSLNYFLSKTGGTVTGTLELIADLYVEDDVYFESTLKVNGDFTGGNALFSGDVDLGNDFRVIGNVIIDSNGSNSNIAGSVLTVKKASTSTGTNVNAFYDVSRNGTSDDSADTYGLINRVVSSSSFDTGGIIGANNVGRHSGTGDAEYVYGALNTAEVTGSGTFPFVNPSVNKASVTGSGTAIIDFMRGNTITINNPNATVNYAQAFHPNITLNSGTLNNGHVIYLDADYTGGSIIGEFAYLRAGVDSDVMGALSGNSNAYFIKSEIDLPSEFAGSISTDNLISGDVNSNHIYNSGTIQTDEVFVDSVLEATTIDVEEIEINIQGAINLTDEQIDAENSNTLVSKGWIEYKLQNLTGVKIYENYQNITSQILNAHRPIAADPIGTILVNTTNKELYVRMSETVWYKFNGLEI